MVELKVLRTSETATVPSKVRDTDSCFDLYADEEVNVITGQTVLVNLGIRVMIPEGYEMEIRERSGLATKGIIIGAGEVDEEYRGLLKVVVRYLQPNPQAPSYFKINVGDRIAQCKLKERIPQTVREISEEEFEADTSRGEGGFGRSGTQ